MPPMREKQWADPKWADSLTAKRDGTSNGDMTHLRNWVVAGLAAVAMAGVAADMAVAQGNPRVYRPIRPNDSLDERWRWALADARRQGFSEFWIAYSFETPVHAQDLVISDSTGTMVSSGGHIRGSGPPLIDVLREGGGNIVVLLRYRGSADAAFDRVAYLSAKLGFAFGRTPVFWLGFADESQSFNRVRALFEGARPERMQRKLIDLASIHGNSNVVIPFLTRLVDLSQPSGIRNEAIEGFGHQHDPRSVEVLLRVARTDPLSELRAEAAETIGEVQTPQSLRALTTLIDDSGDPEVINEAIEALGEVDDPGAMDALVRIIRENSDEEAVDEAIETLNDISQESLHPEILALAASGKTPRLRSSAIDAIADAVSESRDTQLLDRAEQILERAIFDDPDSGVRMEAIDAFEKMPRDRELRVLRQVIERHPDSRVRREAEEHLRDRRR